VRETSTRRSCRSVSQISSLKLVTAVPDTCPPPPSVRKFVARPFPSPTIALSPRKPYTVDMDPTSLQSLVEFEASQPCLLEPLAV
jgi:hypothetical protein